MRRDVVYRTDERGGLALDAYLPATGPGPWPAVLLVNGDGREEAITRAKDWGVFHSYGEHLAARGMVGVPFNHRSSQAVGRAEVAAEVAAALAFVRREARDLAVDPERIAVWAFSAAGAFALADLLRERPSYVRAIVGFYTVWDLEPFRGLPGAPSGADVVRWSATAALGVTSQGLPPILVATADRDSQPFLVGTERFIARGYELGADLRVLRHPGGQHGFDARDDDARSREIIVDALDFLTEQLAPARRM